MRPSLECCPRVGWKTVRCCLGQCSLRCGWQCWLTTQRDWWIAIDTKATFTHIPALADAEELPITGIAPHEHNQMETIFCIHPRAALDVSEVSLWFPHMDCLPLLIYGADPCALLDSSVSIISLPVSRTASSHRDSTCQTTCWATWLAASSWPQSWPWSSLIQDLYWSPLSPLLSQTLCTVGKAALISSFRTGSHCKSMASPSGVPTVLR